jgi:hypothetical protein
MPQQGVLPQLPAATRAIKPIALGNDRSLQANPGNPEVLRAIFSGFSLIGLGVFGIFVYSKDLGGCPYE